MWNRLGTMGRAKSMPFEELKRNALTLASTNQVIAELAGNWATPQGTQIVTEVVMPAMQG